MTRPTTPEAWRAVAETLRWGRDRMDFEYRPDFDAAIELCERMARGELVEAPKPMRPEEEMEARGRAIDEARLVREAALPFDPSAENVAGYKARTGKYPPVEAPKQQTLTTEQLHTWAETGQPPAPTSSEREHADKCLRELLADEHDWSENFVDLILRERAAAAAQAKSECENRIKELKSLLLKCSTTLSMLRPGMKLPSQNDWDRLEQLHNQIAFESGK